MSEALEAVQKLTAVAEKLLRETERLRRDVDRLVYDLGYGEDGPAPVPHHMYDFPKTWPVPAAINTLAAAAAHIESCEYDVRAMRAKLDDEIQPGPTEGQFTQRSAIRTIRPKYVRDR